jgi:hypothetical protein
LDATIVAGQDPAPVLTFDEEKHEYRWGGRVVPNVTRIIAPWTDWSLIPPDRLEAARQRGKVRHKLVEADCMGTTHLYDWPEWTAGARRAWERCKEETGFVAWTSEQRLYHRVYGYAGTADLFGEATKLKGANGPLNWDVKGSEYAGAAIGLQLAAYTCAWNEDAPKDMKVPMANRFALILQDDGKYRLSRYLDPEDWIDFLAALRQLRFRERHYGSSS